MGKWVHFAIGVVLLSLLGGPPGCSTESVGVAELSPLASVRAIGPANQLLIQRRVDAVSRAGDRYSFLIEPTRDSNAAFRAVGRATHAMLSAGGDLDLGGGVVFTRRVASPAVPVLRDGVMHIDAPGDDTDALLFARGDRLEELLVVRQPGAVAYDVRLPSGWSLELGADRSWVDVVDKESLPRFRMVAQSAWDATGAEVPLTLRRDAAGVAIDFAATAAYPLVVDPSFADASVPLKLRLSHTATLLPNGKVLLAGGENGTGIEASAELYDPYRAISTGLPAMSTARTGHTASLLTDGRVLIAGGTNQTGFNARKLDSTELFDPQTNTFSAGPAMSEGRAKHSATRLTDGRILIVGATSAEIFDSATDSFVATGALAQSFLTSVVATRLTDGRVLTLGAGVPVNIAQIFDPLGGGGVGVFTLTNAPTSFDAGGSSLTSLRDGSALALGGCPCGSTGGATSTSAAVERFFPGAFGGVGGFLPTGDVNLARLNHTATLLPSGEVLITGGSDEAPSPEQTAAEIYNPTTGTFTLLGETMSDPRGNHTATLLPTGRVLLLGGEQASAELYVGGGTVESSAVTAGPNLVTARYEHAASRLQDGRVLFTGGFNDGLGDIALAELFDGGAFSATANMSTPRRLHTSTTLLDGRVLVAGGESVGTAEIYDPAEGTFGAVITMTASRRRHAAQLLSDGRVLISGGLDDGGQTLDSAELFDPVTSTFAATAGPMLYPQEGHGAALLPTGKVLVVGGSKAQLFNPANDTFEAAALPGSVHGHTAVGTMPTGSVLVTGGETLAAELYDPIGDAFGFTDSASSAAIHHALLVLPTGEALLSGGHLQTILQPVLNRIDVYNPLAGDGGAFFDGPNMLNSRTGHTTTVLPNGGALIAGGVFCLQLCPIQTQPETELWQPTLGSEAWRPVLTAAPGQVAPGDSVTLTGTGFIGVGNGSGASNDSDTQFPIALWESQLGSIAVGELTEWTHTSATWNVPTTAYAGPGSLRIVVGGVLSVAKPVTITAAPNAVACTFASECNSGFCTDGVCCDAVCDGACEGCTTERKGVGPDGECGEVPAGLHPDDACVVSQGAPCDADDQCESGFCVDAVCCVSECAGQCEACDVVGSVGICVPVQGTPHGDRPACDATPPEDACETKICDGTDRTTCAAVVGPCDPYACSSDGCLEACEDDAACALGYHCEGGECQPGVCDGSVATTADGQVIECAPYNCQPDGSCRTSCGDVDDCAEPFACNFEGRCVPRPPPDDPSSCGCRVVGQPSERGPQPWWIALAMLAVFARRIRPNSLGRAAPLIATALVALTVALPVSAQDGDSDEPTAEAASGEAGASTSDPDLGDADAGETVDSASSAEETAAARKQAQDRFQRGVALVRDESWAAALGEFLESRRIYATRSATNNAAYCLRRLLRYDESLAMYETLLREFPKLPEAKAEEAKDAIADLRGLVGTIEVEDAEPGASIVIDGRNRGIYPPEAPLRVAAGSHVIRLFKEGFEPFETRVDVAGRKSAVVVARLVALSSFGRLSISEKKSGSFTVVVDNVDVGQTPWEGTLSVGEHVVWLRGGESRGTAPVAAPVDEQKTTSLVLEAIELPAAVRIEPRPAAALVRINGVNVGRGTWEGALPEGEHEFDAEAEGFFSARRKVVVAQGEPNVISIALERDEDADRWQIPSKIVADVVASLPLFLTFGGDIVDGCGDDCTQDIGIGGQVALHATYEFGSGVGFGLTGGYLAVSQSIENRDVQVRPVGRPERDGLATDDLSVRAFMVGVHGSLRLGERFPVTLRLAAGPMFATFEDARTGTFALDEGGAYLAGPVVQSQSAIFIDVAPEARIAYPLSEAFEVSAGLVVPILIALERPAWKAESEVDASVDGIGAYSGEALTGAVWAIAAPSIGARYTF